MRKKNIIFSILMMAIGIFAFFYSGQYGKVTSAGSGTTGGDLFPRIAAVGLFLASLYIFVHNLRNKDDSEISIKWSKFFLTVALLALYYILLKPLGFILASTLIVFILMYCLGCRKYWVMVLYGLILSTVIFSIFYYGMYVSLPLGVLAPIIPKY